MFFTLPTYWSIYFLIPIIHLQYLSLSFSDNTWKRCKEWSQSLQFSVGLSQSELKGCMMLWSSCLSVSGCIQNLWKITYLWNSRKYKLLIFSGYVYLKWYSRVWKVILECFFIIDYWWMVVREFSSFL